MKPGIDQGGGKRGGGCNGARSPNIWILIASGGLSKPMCLQLVGLAIYLGGTSTLRISHLTVYFFTFVKLWTKSVVTEGHCVSSTLQRRHGKTIGIFWFSNQQRSIRSILFSCVMWLCPNWKKWVVFLATSLQAARHRQANGKKAFIMSSCPLNFQTLLKLQFKTLFKPSQESHQKHFKVLFYCSCMAINV